MMGEDVLLVIFCEKMTQPVDTPEGKAEVENPLTLHFITVQLGVS